VHDWRDEVQSDSHCHAGKFGRKTAACSRTVRIRCIASLSASAPERRGATSEGEGGSQMR